MVEQEQRYRKQEEQGTGSLESKASGKGGEQVVVFVGTPLFKQDDYFQAAYRADMTVNEAVETSVRELEKTKPEVADGLRNLLKGNHQIKSDGTVIKGTDRLGDIAKIETTEDGRTTYKVAPLDLVETQGGGLYKLLC
jgi:hypothetical protein